MKRALVIAAQLLGAVTVALALAASASAQNGYERFAIVQPEPDQTVHDNNGDVTVEIALEPALARGHEVMLLLDGETVVRWPALAFGLNGLERGTHTLQALITDAHDNVVATSEPVTFNMWQASLLFPVRTHVQPVPTGVQPLSSGAPGKK